MVAKDRPTPPVRGGRGAKKIEELEVEQRIAASPTTVFSYLIDPAKFVEWMGIGARLDPRPGGSFRIDVDGEHFAAGEYVEVQPPHRLVFSWGWEGQDTMPPGSTLVEIELEADGADTILRLRHTGLPDEEQRASHLTGWGQYTGRLAALPRR